MPDDLISDDRSKGFANYVIDGEEARAMIHRFQGDHFTNDRRLSTSVWLSKDAIKHLAKHLDDEVSGVRIYLAAYNKRVVPSQKFDDQATIILVPTIGRIDDFDRIPPPDRYAINHGDLCPTECNGAIW